MLKAIETKYAGCRFRSRLEARWAVFFDALGVEWNYEPEGFELPSGRYLPDFWLPSVGNGCFIEIKPQPLSDEEITMASELAYESGKYVMAFVGKPGSHTIEEFRKKTPLEQWQIDVFRMIYKNHKWSAKRFAMDQGFRDWTPLSDEIEFSSHGPDNDLKCGVIRAERCLSYCRTHKAMSFGFFNEAYSQCGHCGECHVTELHATRRCFEADRPGESYNCDDFTHGNELSSALEAALSARFEFGECG